MSDENTTQEVLDIEGTDMPTTNTVDTAPANVDELLQTAVAHGATVEQLERIMALRRELQGEYARNRFYDAMASLQSQLPEIPKTREVYDKGGKLRYRYADSAAIMRILRPLMRDHGFSVTVRTSQEDSSVTALVDVRHAEGHVETTTFTVPVDKEAYMSEPQKVASALTFARRYAVIDAFGIATADEDDDANLSFEDGRKYGTYIDGLDGCKDVEELRNLTKQYVDSLRAKGDEHGRKIIMTFYESRKKEITGGGNG